MADEQSLVLVAIVVAAPGLWYVGARRDQVSDFWFVAVAASFIAMGVGYTEELSILYWIGALALIFSTTAATLQIRRRKAASEATPEQRNEAD
ncbi:hypothetical protein GCM10009789_08060 [Kribbella sancticallisti]|uniref:Uncharacterized protein n=1 Tax=Kribbella sancticallisti TaxID=460087 RepID=A0ABN2CG44_9ACTN